MRFFCLLFFTLIVYCSAAQTYYISATGSDAVGNGSINNPWRTLAKAAATVTDTGSTIHVKAGTYIETEQARLAPGVSIEGEDSSSIIKSAIKDDWKEILSLHSEEGVNGNQHITNIKFDGQDLSTFWAIYISGRSNVSIHDCIFTNFKDRAVIFTARNDDKPLAPAVYSTGNKFYNNKVFNCAAYNTSNGIYGRGCLNIGGQEGMLIYNNYMVQNQRPDGYNGFLIKYHNEGFLKGVKIFNNTLIKIPFAGQYAGDNGWDFAMEFWNIEGGMEIYGNTIQGAIDIVNTSKGTYDFGIWIHDNKLGQPVLNDHYESGFIFEVSNESVIVENNVLSRVSGPVLFYAQENTVLSDVVIRNNLFEEIGRRTGNGNNGSAININVGTRLGDINHYALSNLLIENNTMIAAEGNAPFYGIEITGAGMVSNVRIRKNRINGFVAGCLVANPARVIDGMTMEDNILTNNGNNNDPFYIIGSPSNYRFRNNTQSGSSSAGGSSGIRQQLIRPLYYEAKNMAPLQLIAILSFIIFFLFARRENAYAFPACVLHATVTGVLGFENGAYGSVLLCLYFIAVSIYGWISWRKRDRKGHRVVRIAYSFRKELLIQLLIFAVSFAGIYWALHFAGHLFPAGAIDWVDALVYAASVPALWAMANKKLENWYWWMASNAVAVPAYLAKHYLLFSSFHFLLFAISIWALFKWKKRMTRRRI